VKYGFIKFSKKSSQTHCNARTGKQRVFYSSDLIYQVASIFEYDLLDEKWLSW